MCTLRMSGRSSLLVGLSPAAFDGSGLPLADARESKSDVVAAPADSPAGATVHDMTALVAAQTGDQSASFTALARTSAALFQTAGPQRPSSMRDSMPATIPGTIQASPMSDSTLDSPASTAPTQRGLPDGDVDRDDDAGTTHLTEREHRWATDFRTPAPNFAFYSARPILTLAVN